MQTTSDPRGLDDFTSTRSRDEVVPHVRGASTQRRQEFLYENEVHAARTTFAAKDYKMKLACEKRSDFTHRNSTGLFCLVQQQVEAALGGRRVNHKKV